MIMIPNHILRFCVAIPRPSFSKHPMHLLRPDLLPIPMSRLYVLSRRRSRILGPALAPIVILGTARIPTHAFPCSDSPEIEKDIIVWAEK
jgi:hypothetical protein